MSFSLKRYYAHPEAGYLIASILFVITGLTVGFSLLLPFWISLVLAYLQQYPINALAKHLPYHQATIVVFSISLLVIFGGLFALIPFLHNETAHFFHDLPAMVDKAGDFIEKYFLFGVKLQQPFSHIVIDKTHTILSRSVSIAFHYAPSAIHTLIYIVTIPVMVFFLNYDREMFLKNFSAIFPQDRPCLDKIASEISIQLDYFVRGKIVHMIVMGVASYILFRLFSLNFAALLSIPMGLSVFIPFLGTALATVPLLLIAYAQFGLSWTILNLMVGYGVLQLWESNILVPMIFSQSNDLHPVTILGSVLVFGALGGVLGVFLAIPLTVILKILIQYWPIAPQYSDRSAVEYE